MPLHPSGYILRFLGFSTLLFTLSMTIFFTLYSISSLSAHSVIAPLCTTSVVFNIATCMLLFLFTISPPEKHLYLLGGIISTVLAVIISTLALGWMSFRPQDMPNVIFGRDRKPMVIAGFSLFVVSLVFQTIFWTLRVFTCPNSSDMVERGLMSPQAEAAEKPASSYGSAPTSLLPAVVGGEKYAVFMGHVLHHTPNLYNSTVLYVTETPPVMVPVVEVDPFDAWDTSDVGATQRAACALEVGLGIFTPGESPVTGTCLEENVVGMDKTEDETYDVQIHVPILERQNSPPIPDYDMTPRSSSFPVGIFRDHGLMSTSRRPAICVSPIRECRTFE